MRLACSVVHRWLGESLIMLSVDCEVRCVNIVALHYHVEDLWLMNGSFLQQFDCQAGLAHFLQHLLH